jgi:16S rRNA (cytosine1402-N4)-methyltransferase
LFIDCTLGLGGHAEAILAASPESRVIGLDRDEEALALARQRLAGFGGRILTVKANFAELHSVLERIDATRIRGVLADLGVSSMQLDRSERGFSFADDAPLDMRTDASQAVTAASLVNELPERNLADLIFEFGEERKSRRIARLIVREREREPLTTTKRLADIVVRALRVPGRWRIHPATRTFQALRIAVNGELDALAALIPAAISALEAGGRLAIISFHSLEDRIVKREFRRHSGRCVCDSAMRLRPERGQAGCEGCGARRLVEVLTRKPIRPGEDEIAINSRSRSAVMRVCEKL